MNQKRRSFIIERWGRKGNMFSFVCCLFVFLPSDEEENKAKARNEKRAQKITKITGM